MRVLYYANKRIQSLSQLFMACLDSNINPYPSNRALDALELADIVRGPSPYSMPRGNKRSLSLPLDGVVGDTILPELQLESVEPVPRSPTPVPEETNIERTRRTRSRSRSCSAAATTSLYPLPSIAEEVSEFASNVATMPSEDVMCSASSTSSSFIVLSSLSTDDTPSLLNQDLMLLPSASATSSTSSGSFSNDPFSLSLRRPVPYVSVPVPTTPAPPPLYSFAASTGTSSNSSNSSNSSGGDLEILTPTSSPLFHSPGRLGLGLGLGAGLVNGGVHGQGLGVHGLYKDSGEAFDGLGLVPRTPLHLRLRSSSHSSESSSSSSGGGSISSSPPKPPTRIFLEEILATFSDSVLLSSSAATAARPQAMPLTPSNSESTCDIFIASHTPSRVQDAGGNTSRSPIASRGALFASSPSTVKVRSGLLQVHGLCEALDFCEDSEERSRSYSVSSGSSVGRSPSAGNERGQGVRMVGIGRGSGSLRRETVASRARGSGRPRSMGECVGGDGVVRPTWRY
ncbi:uncharacterized protein STEHIDRAFT_169286 [Stereum hirsutum FP-91666 SS1]|uniref:uncharacterized protein n=1 Tax=Stereum hirsutum (strain FP-91666) TaxID=721885 RepID=UPI000444A7D9|nr:uncharacterized protein STEHIDRAFT_169286 [Stereum hirsutum FP-91666 SS1]EIM85311.1 hypothetical protein STEHIDRAFT_169286 [Stereum hirsutum FP-91666 SS1]